MTDDVDYELELYRGVTVPVPGWLLTRPAIFAAGFLTGLLVALAAFLAGVYLAFT